MQEFMEKLLSVCIIAKNEEKMLPGCLDSLRAVAGEIIVVDTGSSDRTKEIALSYGCKVYEVAWENDFSKARNACLDKASLPFILSIDADERLLNPELLLKEIENPPEEIYGWLIKVTSESARTGGGKDLYTSHLLRLFRNHPDIRFDGNIHEQIISSIVNLQFKIKSTPIELYHLGYSYNPQAMQQKQLRNLTLLNSALEKDPKNGYNIFQRAKTYLALGDLEKAEQDIKLALQILQPDNASYPQTLNYGAIVAYRLGLRELSVDRARQSLKIIPTQSFANFILAENFADMQMYCDALKHYKSIENADENSTIMYQVVGDYKMPPEQLQFKIGRMLLKLDEYDAAELHFDRGLEINPNDINCITGKANACFKKQEFDVAKALIENASRIAPDNSRLKKYLEKVEKALSAKNNAERLNSKEAMQPKVNIRTKPLISLSMIVKNEEIMLTDCLESIKDIVDEIVIVDTGSTDSTKEIANQYNAHIYDFQWQNDFASARNKSLSKCTGKWILYLDADERLEEGKNIIREMLENAPDDIGAFICTIESAHATLTGESELHRGGYPRIFRNYGYPTIKFVGRVHEQISPSITDMGKKMQFSDIVIKHLGYDRTKEEMQEKIKRNYTMLIEHINEEPTNAYAWYQLGQTLAQMNLRQQAEDAVRFSLQLGKLSDSVYASACSTLAQLCGSKKNFQEALHWAEKSLEKAPKQLYALHLKAYALLYMNRAKEAEQLFLEVKRRKTSEKGTPRSGFDIVIPDNAIDEALLKARKVIENH